MRFLNKLDSGVCNISKRFLGFLEDRLAPLTLMVLTTVLVLSSWFWDSWSGKEESVGSAIRNLVLVLAAIAALPLAIWRSKVAERQADTAQRGQLDERYQKGAEMLGSGVLSVRLGAIDALSDLAFEHPEDYHMKVMSLLCAFARHPGRNKEGNDSVRVLEDIQGVMIAIHARSATQIEIEKQGDYILNLPQTNLNYLFLRGANLARANLIEADLHRANLGEADLNHAHLDGANLGGADLGRANLRRVMALGVRLNQVNLDGADLDGADLAGADPQANLTGTNLKNCKGLTQEQIDEAVADSDNPPTLEGVIDANTGEPLVWRGAGVSG